MFCTTCGQALADGAAFCTNCGTPRGEATVAPEPAGFGQLAPTPLDPNPPILALRGEAKFAFTGKGIDLFVLALVNGLLGFVTLGIYSFWGRTRIREWWHQNLSLAGYQFGWHGTGMELFIGFLKVMGMSLVLLLVTLAPFLFMNSQTASSLQTLLFYIGLAFVSPVAIFGAVRYRLSRSSLHHIRFGLNGRLSECYWPILREFFLLVITLGIYRPYFDTHLREYFVNRVYFGNAKFRFTGNASDLMSSYLWAYFLYLPTLSYSMAWYRAKREKYFWAHTAVDRATFQLDVDPMEYAVFHVATTMLTTATLGIGWAWSQTMEARYFLDRMTLAGDAVVTSQFPDTGVPDATGEELGDALEIDLSL